MTEKRTRRRFQFSLRTLLVFVLLVSIGMSWLGVKLERARRQRQAVSVIRAAGLVYYDYRADDPSGRPSVPKWARGLLGDDFFFDVVMVSNVEDFGDEEASHLRALRNLTHVDLGGTQMTDAGLSHVKELTGLERLGLGSTYITNVGLKYLEGLTNLTLLDLCNTQVTPEDVKKLQEALPQCEVLY